MASAARGVDVDRRWRTWTPALPSRRCEAVFVETSFPVEWQAVTESRIEWTDRSDWNAFRGCARVSEGCRNCYAESIAARFSGPGQPFHGFAERTAHGPRWTGNVELIEERLLLPLKWRKPAKIFVNSTYDLFHEKITDAQIDRVFAVMALAPQHVFQILTKRSARMRSYCSDSDTPERIVASMMTIGNWTRTPEIKWPLINCWLGVSTERQQEADERIPDLLATPAAVRFVSAEPMIGAIDFTAIDFRAYMNAATNGRLGEPHEYDPIMKWPLLAPFEHWPSGYSSPGLDWIIVGSESGPGARPMRVEWARSIVDQCQNAGVACFVKQLGPKPIMSRADAVQAVALGTGWDSRSGHECGTVTLRDRKGGDMIEWPADIRMRQFPGKVTRCVPSAT